MSSFADLLVIVVLCGVFTASGCSKASSVYVKDYDQSCASVADCVAVPDGPRNECCGHMVCPAAAINMSALAAFTDARKGVTTCPQLPSCPHLATPACPPSRVQCTAGTCELILPDGGTADAS
jgi:hypothetical protein